MNLTIGEAVVGNVSAGQTLLDYGYWWSVVSANVGVTDDGALVRTLVEGNTEPGWHTAAWDGRDNHGRRLNTGVYFSVLTASGIHLTRKIVLIN